MVPLGRGPITKIVPIIVIYPQYLSSNKPSAPSLPPRQERRNLPGIRDPCFLVFEHYSHVISSCDVVVATYIVVVAVTKMKWELVVGDGIEVVVGRHRYRVEVEMVGVESADARKMGSCLLSKGKEEVR